MSDYPDLVRRLREVAQRANLGPWRAEEERVFSKHGAPLALVYLSTNDALHIAACDPQTILRLLYVIDEADKLRACGDIAELLEQHLAYDVARKALDER